MHNGDRNATDLTEYFKVFTIRQLAQHQWKVYIRLTCLSHVNQERSVVIQKVLFHGSGLGQAAISCETKSAMMLAIPLCECQVKVVLSNISGVDKEKLMGSPKMTRRSKVIVSTDGRVLHRSSVGRLHGGKNVPARATQVQLSTKNRWIGHLKQTQPRHPIPHTFFVLRTTRQKRMGCSPF